MGHERRRLRLQMGHHVRKSSMLVKSPISMSHARMEWDAVDLTTFKRSASASVPRCHNRRIGLQVATIRPVPASMILWARVRLAPYRNIQKWAQQKLRRIT